jgi:hypothetical protein
MPLSVAQRKYQMHPTTGTQPWRYLLGQAGLGGGAAYRARRGAAGRRHRWARGALAPPAHRSAAGGRYQRRRSVLRQVCALTGGAMEAVVSQRRGKHASHAFVTPGDLDPRLRRTRGSGDTGGECGGWRGQMSGSQQEGGRGLCWSCGKPGAYAGGWRMTCPGCEVSWMPWSSALRGDPKPVCWMGKVIDCVDFTGPGALGAPA